jgi:hypothetical protein
MDISLLKRNISLQSVISFFTNQFDIRLVALTEAKMFAEMKLDDNTFYFITTATIKQLWEVLLV